MKDAEQVDVPIENGEKLSIIEKFMNDKIFILKGNRYSDISLINYLTVTDFYNEYRKYCIKNKVEFSPKNIFFLSFCREYPHFMNRRLLLREKIDERRIPVLVGFEVIKGDN